MDDAERIWQDAVRRWHTDPEFHARVTLARQMTVVLDKVDQDRVPIAPFVLAAHVATLPIEELVAPPTQTVIESMVPRWVPGQDTLDAWGATLGPALGGGAYRLIPKDPCPCGAFSRDSEWHTADCKDYVKPKDYPEGL